MCFQSKCGKCSKTTWQGCGRHVESVYKQIPEGQHCMCKDWPGVSIDDLVASRKINADQKASIQKKPQLEAQLSALEEQLMHYKKFDSEFQSQLQKQKEELTGQHQQELEKTREDMRLFGVTQSEAKLREKFPPVFVNTPPCW